jgi:hypothetical protein
MKETCKQGTGLSLRCTNVTVQQNCRKRITRMQLQNVLRGSDQSRRINMHEYFGGRN